MKTYIAAALSGIMLLASSLTGEAHHLEPSDFTVAGFTKDTTAYDVRRAWGEPVVTGTVSGDYKKSGIWHLKIRDSIWVYPDFSLLFSDSRYGREKIYSLAVLYDSGCPLPKGIRLGDSAEKVKKIYGSPSAERTEENGDFIWEYRGETEEKEADGPSLHMKFRKDRLIGAVLFFRSE